MPSSFARFFSSGTVQSSYEPDFPPFLATADFPRAAAALEILAAFSFELPSLRRSWYNFSFLIDGFGIVTTSGGWLPPPEGFPSRSRGKRVSASEDNLRAVHVEPDRQVEHPFQPCPLDGLHGRRVDPGQLLDRLALDQTEQRVIGGAQQVLRVSLKRRAVFRIRRRRIRTLDAFDHGLGQHVTRRTAQQALLPPVVGLERPRRVVHVLDKAVIAERHADLQTYCH